MRGDDLSSILRLITYMYNSGLSKREIAWKIGITPSKLSGILRRGLEYGLLEEYYYVPIEKLGGQTYVYMIRLQQRTSLKECLKSLIPPDLLAYTPTPEPTFMAIYVASHTPIRLETKNPLCRIILAETVKESSFIYFTPRGNAIVEYKPGVVKPDDPLDIMIARNLFTLYNPPMGRFGIDDLASYFSKYIRKTQFQYHYYKHVLGKIAFKKYVPHTAPGSKTYCYTVFYSNSKVSVDTLIQIISNIGTHVANYTLITLSHEPYIGILLGKCDKENLADPTIWHEPQPDIFYEIYPATPLYKTENI